MIPSSFAEYFGFPSVTSNTELFEPDLKLNLTFDILAMFAEGNSKVASIVFDQPSPANLNKTRG